MNFATSTQLQQWRFNNDEIRDRRQSARNKFLDALIANPAGFADESQMDPSTTQSTASSTESTVQSSNSKKTSSNISMTDVPAKRARLENKAGHVDLGKMKLSVQEEQLVLRSWMLHLDNILSQRTSKLFLTPFSRCTAWTFLHRFYLGQSMLKFPIETMMPAALLLATKAEEEEFANMSHLIASVMESIDKRKRNVLQRRQEMVSAELSLVLELKGALVVYHPLTYLAPLCSEFRKWLERRQKSRGQVMRKGYLQERFKYIYREAEKIVLYTQWTDCQLLHPAPIIAGAAIRLASGPVMKQTFPREKVRLEDEYFKSNGIGSLDFAQLIHLMVGSSLGHKIERVEHYLLDCDRADASNDVLCMIQDAVTRYYHIGKALLSTEGGKKMRKARKHLEQSMNIIKRYREQHGGGTLVVGTKTSNEPTATAKRDIAERALKKT